MTIPWPWFHGKDTGYPEPLIAVTNGGKVVFAKGYGYSDVAVTGEKVHSRQSLSDCKYFETDHCGRCAAIA